MFKRNDSLPSYIYLYFLCQSINLTAAIISVAVAATVGHQMAPDSSLGTLPYGTQFFFLLLATYPVSLLMDKKGRKSGFYSGAVFLFLSGLTGYFAIINQSFSLLIISHALLGVFTACANYYRFAATDHLDGKLKSRALSLVVAGGLLAAFFGPLISRYTRDIDGYPLFAITYGCLMILSLLNILLLKLIPDQKQTGEDRKPSEDDLQLTLKQLQGFPMLFAILASALSYGLMNLVMIQSSLQMHQMNVSFSHSTEAIQWHVVAMFFPSFFSGYLITRLGHNKLITTGLCLFLVTFLINIFYTDLSALMLSLVFLGVAWNFCYVGGSAYLAALVANNAQAERWQGAGDTAIAVFAMLGALLPSVLMSTLGWKGSNLLCVFITMGALGISFLLIFCRQQGRLKATDT